MDIFLLALLILNNNSALQLISYKLMGFLVELGTV